MKNLFYILIASALLLSCKKDEKTIQLSGTVMDPYLGAPVAGVNVNLQANGVVDGVYNASYVTLATTTTDAAGHFSFVVDESSYDSFRFNFLKAGYNTSQVVVNTGSISPESPYSGSFNISSKAWVTLQIKNTSPYDADDILNFTFQNNPVTCSDCCPPVPVEFTGINVDTVYTCQSVGSFDLVLFKTVIKNNSTFSVADTLRTIPMDTLIYLLEY